MKIVIEGNKRKVEAIAKQAKNTSGVEVCVADCECVKEEKPSDILEVANGESHKKKSTPKAKKKSTPKAE